MKNHNVLPSVCIVGRPNVGKSSIFNWMVGHRKAVVVEESGTTRDRVEEEIKIKNKKVTLVDTGGYLSEDKDLMSTKIKDQIRAAVSESTVLLMILSTIDGITPADLEILEILRKHNKPMILIANKTDNMKLEREVYEFYQLGLGEPVVVSCIHKIGLKKIKSAIDKALSRVDTSGDAGGEEGIRIAVVGRPNVGKSSFINHILNRDRVIVSDIPGTTRDSIDIIFNDGKDDYVLIDTAGIRHKRKIRSVVDVFSIMRSQESIRRAEVIILILDAADGITNDDIGILRTVKDHGKACIIIVNKWDLAENAEEVTIADYEKSLIEESPMLRIFPIYFVSAKTGKNVVKSFSQVKVLNNGLDMKVSTARLNKIFDKNDPSQLSVPRGNKRPRFKYVTQTGARPVEFTFFVNDPQTVIPVHVGYIENILRDNLELKGIPVKILFKRSSKQLERKHNG